MAQPLFRVQLLRKASGRDEFHQPPGAGLLCRLLQDLRGQEVQRLPEPHHRLALYVPEFLLNTSAFTMRACSHSLV